MRTVFYPLGSDHPISKEECGLCGQVLSYYALRRCFRCNRLFCKSCVTEDLIDDRYLICLNCAKRFVSSKGGFRGKYVPLTLYLSRKARWSRWVRLHFSQIEGMIGNNLPVSATKDMKWWNNTTNTTQGRAWFSIGWKVKEVDLKKGRVIFTREDLIKNKKRPKPKKLSSNVLPTYKRRKSKHPSLTKIARAQVRLQNVNRRKASMRRHRGKFRPRSAYEKRLYDPSKKPTIYV